MPDPATSAAAVFEGYKLGQHVWYWLVKRRHKVSFGQFIKSFEEKNGEVSKDDKYRIREDLRDRGLLFTDTRGHKWVLPKPIYKY